MPKLLYFFRVRLPVALLVAVLAAGAAGLTLYVTPNTYTDCPGQPCEILARYVQNTAKYFKSDTTMLFLPGLHYLEFSIAIKLQHVRNFTMIGNFTSTKNTVSSNSHRPRATASKIECSQTYTGFAFFNASRIHIENLTFAQCSHRLVRKVRAALAFDTVWDVNITRVTVANSTGYGLHADSVFGDFRVSETVFVNNTGGKYYYGGNARFWYGQCRENGSRTHLRIRSSRFLLGKDIAKYSSYYPAATGISMFITCPQIIVELLNVTVLGNRADNGGNVAINITNSRGTQVSIADSTIGLGMGHRGGGLRVWSVIGDTSTESTHTILNVSNTRFYSNYAEAGGGALYISHYETKQQGGTTNRIIFENCTFSNNTVPPKGKGAVTEILKHRILGYETHTIPQFEIVFQNSSFTSNSLLVDERNSFIGAIVNIFSVERAIFNNCTFTNNSNTAIAVQNTNLVFEGNNLFQNNTGTNGGALRLCDTSIIYVRNETYIMFIDNHARESGGAIYAQQRCLESAPPCFFQPDVPDFTPVADLERMRLTFINNTAEYAGSGLYGGAVDFSYTYQHFRYKKKSSYYYTTTIFTKIFDFSQQPGNSKITSDPYGVCLCSENNLRACYLKNYTYPRKVYPGEVFNISAVAVGQRNGVVPGIIQPLILNRNQDTIPRKYWYQKALNECTVINFTILSQSDHETFNLTVEQSYPGGSFYYRFSPPSITVQLQPCPWGFRFQDDPPMCKCNPLLEEQQITCSINDQTVLRRHPVWISCHNEESQSTQPAAQCVGVAMQHHCPFDYCKPQDINITLSTIDDQCSAGRTGALCGKCKDGLSAVLGSSKCQVCTHYYLFLLFAFALAGVALVFLLITCNMTVSEGTLNGLIFYVNIIQMNRSMFFRTDQGNVLTVFIAWLNLDLGIETCFYDGLNTYTNTWLQFVFPVYIWLITGAIIYISRKSSIAARLFGRNAVKVLATLLLLSCAKLQRACIKVFQFAWIHFDDNSTRTVWLSDGNIPYFHGKHVPLMFVALVFGVLTLPYALVLTFIQCLKMAPSFKILFWVKRLKPVFDAYTGPYKNKCAFWTGLILSIRTILFTSFAVNILGEPDFNLTVTAFVCLLVLMLARSIGGVYKQQFLDILESWFFLNLGILCVVTGYILNHVSKEHQAVKYQSAATYLLVGAALLTFIGILTYHSYKQLADIGAWAAIAGWIHKNKMGHTRMQPVIDGSQEGGNAEERWPVVARFDAYREPVLEHEDQS